VHGFPRTSLMWRFLAPMLAEKHTVICVELRAYGRSGIPASTDDHFPYSKRAIAKKLVDVMGKLGFPTFTIIGHDRGGRVSYRLAFSRFEHAWYSLTELRINSTCHQHYCRLRWKHECKCFHPVTSSSPSIQPKTPDGGSCWLPPMAVKVWPASVRMLLSM
jgi:hypothetical protein